MLDMVAVAGVVVVFIVTVTHVLCHSRVVSLCALSTDRLAADVNNRLLHEGLVID